MLFDELLHFWFLDTFTVIFADMIVIVADDIV